MDESLATANTEGAETVETETAADSPAHVLDVAERLLALAERDNVEMTMDKLQSLCYYVQGWTLAVTGRRAFTQPIYAAREGVWIEEIGDAFEVFGDESFTLQDAVRAGIIRDPAAAEVTEHGGPS